MLRAFTLLLRRKLMMPFALGIALAGALFSSAHAAESPGVQVAGKSGSLQLTLSLAKTHFKAGESPWALIRIQNISTQSVTISDQALLDPWKLRDNWYYRLQTFVELQSGDGRKSFDPFVLPELGGPDLIDRPHGSHGDSPEEKKLEDRLAKLRRLWKKQGFSAEEIVLKEGAYAEEYRKGIAPRTEQITLKPGETVSTLPWIYQTSREKRQGLSAQVPIQGYMRLGEIPNPGTYRIRAVYDFRLERSENKKTNQKVVQPRADEVRIETPWLTISVVK